MPQAEIAKVHATQEALRRVEEYEFEMRRRKGRHHSTRQQALPTPFARTSMLGVTVSPDVPAPSLQSAPQMAPQTTAQPTPTVSIALGDVHHDSPSGGLLPPPAHPISEQPPPPDVPDAPDKGVRDSADGANFVAVAVGWVKGLVTPQSGRSNSSTADSNSAPARTAHLGAITEEVKRVSDLELGIDPGLQTRSQSDYGLKA